MYRMICLCLGKCLSMLRTKSRCARQRSAYSSVSISTSWGKWLGSTLPLEEVLGTRRCRRCGRCRCARGSVELGLHIGGDVGSFEFGSDVALWIEPSTHVEDIFVVAEAIEDVAAGTV
mmetsp:Transcript_37099/g.83841  ORF Transcript_37099/g.83841 Transcript_37099/m.83841 type:complete len:118 (+) Transcript_37099:68-421(+)